MVKLYFKPLLDLVILEVYDSFNQISSGKVLAIGPEAFGDVTKQDFSVGDEVLFGTRYINEGNILSPRLIKGDEKSIVFMIKSKFVLGVMDPSNTRSQPIVYESVKDFLNRT